MADLLYADITGDILNAYEAVFKRLRHPQGYPEAAATEALVRELRRRGHQVRTEVVITHRDRGKALGTGRADFIVDGKVAVEVKRVKDFTYRHVKQLRAYLDSGGLAVGLLLNFGGEEMQRQRVYEPRHDPTLPENQR